MEQQEVALFEGVKGARVDTLYQGILFSLDQDVACNLLPCYNIRQFKLVQLAVFVPTYLINFKHGPGRI